MKRTFTSASAGKYLKALEEEKANLLRRERECCTYVVGEGEEPCPPAYDYADTRARVAEIDAKTLRLRHALHLFNGETVLEGPGITIDEALILMAQLSRERQVLASMRARQPRTRLGAPSWHAPARAASVEWQVASYDPAEADRDWREVSDRIAELQLAVDLANQTITFEADA